MSIRVKTAVILFAVFVLYGFLDYAVHEWVVYPRFSALERRDAIASMERCFDALDSEIMHLLDASQRLALAQHPEVGTATVDASAFMAEHFTTNVLAANRINFVALLGADGAVLADAAYDYRRGKRIASPLVKEAFQEKIGSVVTRMEGEVASGIMMLPSGPVLVAAVPIGSPADGALIAGRHVAGSVLETICSRALVDFHLDPIPEGSPKARRTQDDGFAGYSSYEMASGELHVSTALADIEGRPVCLASARIPRDIVREGKRAKRYAVLIVLTGGLLLLLTLVMLLERTVLRRMLELGRAVDKVATTRDLSTRLPVKGRDEMSRLTAGVNIMLAALQQSDADLRASEERYRMLFREMLGGFALHEIICDQDGKPYDYRFLEANPSFEAQTGLKVEDVLGKTAREVMPSIEAELIDAFGEVALTGNPARFEAQVRALKKHFELAVFSPAKGQFAAIFRDVTDRNRAQEERQRMQSQFQQAQKLESLGVLAGGIAHDFNNLLVGILGSADLAREDLPEGSPAAVSVANIEKASKRAADLCKQMLAYSGKGTYAVASVDLRRVIREMTRLLEVSVAKNVVIKYALGEDIPHVNADAPQMHQVIMNLVTNASEAIEGRSGTIDVSVSTIDCDDRFLADAVPAGNTSPGRYVCVEVRDNGCGMDEQTIAQVFDPFFTTKFIGRGLGLAAVLGIVRGHNGGIKVESEVGKGTCFRVLFPVAQETLSEAEDGEAPPAGESWAGWGCVILADDDEIVRSVGQRMLQKVGFNVLTAVNGLEAVGLLKERKDDVTCIVLDLTMPRMDGEAAFQKIREISADVPVLISSGYDEHAIAERFAGKSIAGFVQKPYRTADLLGKVREALVSE
jgi:PAS domain S-box-containing protein